MVQKTRLSINALLLPKQLGGIGNYTFYLIRSLRQLRPDWEIHLLVNKDAAENFRSLSGLKISEIGIRSRIGRLCYLHFIFPFIAYRYQLVHSIGNMGLVLCPARQVITIHDVYECVSPERFSLGKRLLMRMLVAASGFMARRILTDSINSGKDISRYYPYLTKKLSVVYLGNKYPISTVIKSEGRSGFLFVGTVEPGKNLTLVIKAFAQFRKSHINGGNLKVVGAMGWKQSRIPSLLKTLDIEQAVEFLGYVPDSQLPDLYSSVIALIQASNYEGFGLPVIEAMACGCPVIAARNSGLIEAGGESALFFETGDTTGLLDRMEELANSELVRRNCIISGYAHAKAFTWEKTAAHTLAVYDSALKT